MTGAEEPLSSITGFSLAVLWAALIWATGAMLLCSPSRNPTRRHGGRRTGAAC